MTMPRNQLITTLAIDTSTSCGSIALLRDRMVIGELRVNSQETHSARLLRSVQYLLDCTGRTLTDVSLVAAGIGPGSFTGIRIGVATALGLAQSLGVPFSGISGLDALARQASFHEGSVGVVVDAQRSQVFYAEYVSRGGKVRRTGRPSIWYPSDLELHLRKRHLYIIGDDGLRYLRSPGKSWPRFIAADMFLAADIGRLALTHKRSWRSGQYLSAEPLYIRPPDALRLKKQAAR